MEITYRSTPISGSFVPESQVDSVNGFEVKKFDDVLYLVNANKEKIKLVAETKTAQDVINLFSSDPANTETIYGVEAADGKVAIVIHQFSGKPIKLIDPHDQMNLYVERGTAAKLCEELNITEHQLVDWLNKQFMIFAKAKSSNSQVADLIKQQFPASKTDLSNSEISSEELVNIFEEDKKLRHCEELYSVVSNSLFKKKEMQSEVIGIDENFDTIYCMAQSKIGQALTSKTMRRFLSIGDFFDPSEPKIKEWGGHKTGFLLCHPAQDFRNNLLRIERLLGYFVFGKTLQEEKDGHICPICGAPTLRSYGGDDFVCTTCKHAISYSFDSTCLERKVSKTLRFFRLSSSEMSMHSSGLFPDAITLSTTVFETVLRVRIRS